MSKKRPARKSRLYTIHCPTCHKIKTVQVCPQCYADLGGQTPPRPNECFECHTKNSHTPEAGVEQWSVDMMKRLNAKD